MPAVVGGKRCWIPSWNPGLALGHAVLCRVQTSFLSRSDPKGIIISGGETREKERERERERERE